MRVSADRDSCIGAGKCVTVAPGTFDQDDDGIVLVLSPAPGADEEASVRQAVELCPVQALRA